LAKAGWPAPERFPHNALGNTVQAVVDADLLASRNPLIVTGFVGLDSLIGLFASRWWLGSLSEGNVGEAVALAEA
jgi:hypothetical protein